jgi:hypothetical protein
LIKSFANCTVKNKLRKKRYFGFGLGYLEIEGVLWLLHRWDLEEKRGEAERLLGGGEEAGNSRVGAVAGGRAPPVNCIGDFRFIWIRDGLDQVLQGERRGGGKEVRGSLCSGAQAGGGGRGAMWEEAERTMGGRARRRGRRHAPHTHREKSENSPWRQRCIRFVDTSERSTGHHYLHPYSRRLGGRT